MQKSSIKEKYCEYITDEADVTFYCNKTLPVTQEGT